MDPLNLCHKWNYVLTNLILHFLTVTCIHYKLWLQIWFYESWIVKDLIDCSVFFHNVTVMLTFSVTLDTCCNMSVAEGWKIITENIRGLFVVNIIRPLNPLHHILLQLDPSHNINDNTIDLVSRHTTRWETGSSVIHFGVAGSVTSFVIGSPSGFFWFIHVCLWLICLIQIS